MKLTAWFTSPTVRDICSKHRFFSSTTIKKGEKNVDLEKRSPTP